MHAFCPLDVGHKFAGYRCGEVDYRLLPCQRCKAGTVGLDYILQALQKKNRRAFSGKKTRSYFSRTYRISSMFVLLRIYRRSENVEICLPICLEKNDLNTN